MRPVSYFVDTYPRSRRPDYSRQHGEVSTDVAIVGGGLTGCACALAFAGAGVKVVLLEAERVGIGATAASAGLVRQSLDASFQESVKRHGVRTARHVWQSFRRASLDFSAVLRRAGVRADVIPQDLILLSRDPDGARILAKEWRARRDGGLDASWLTARAVHTETGLTAAGGIRTKGEAFDPYRACLGLAAAAASKGAHVHEQSRVRRIRSRRKSVEVTTETGVVTANAVVIATGALPDDLRALRRHFAPLMSYAAVTQSMPAAVRREVGKRTAALRDTHVPPHLVRWLKDDRVLVTGGARPSLSGRSRQKLLVPQVQELMYELTTLYPAISGLQPEWGWDVDAYGSPDELPVIGPHRNFPRHLFALGTGLHGAGMAWLAARVLLRAYLQEPAKGDDLFGFARVL
jgi:glycine/D-amino acid oxidase-like deaminating enzyme